jgi:hypothetical protein
MSIGSTYWQSRDPWLGSAVQHITLLRLFRQVHTPPTLFTTVPEPRLLVELVRWKPCVNVIARSITTFAQFCQSLDILHHKHHEHLATGKPELLWWIGLKIDAGNSIRSGSMLSLPRAIAERQGVRPGVPVVPGLRKHHRPMVQKNTAWRNVHVRPIDVIQIDPRKSFGN